MHNADKIKTGFTMINNFLKLETNTLDIPFALKIFFWEFVRGDKAIKEFEQYIYSSHQLPLIFTELSYTQLMMTDYRDRDDVFKVKQELFKFLSSIPLSCLCPTICNTPRFSITNDGPYRILDDYTNNFLTLNSIKDFSGQHPIHNSYWYFDAELNQCKVCNTLWFTVQEECFCDYYLVRLNEVEFDAINSDVSWPNKKWPESLMSWENFDKNKFIAWGDMYVAQGHSTATNKNFLENFSLRIDYRIHKNDT